MWLSRATVCRPMFSREATWSRTFREWSTRKRTCANRRLLCEHLSVSTRAIAATAIGLGVVVAGMVAAALLYVYDCADTTSVYDPACNDGRDGVLQPTGFGTAVLVGIALGVLV